MKRSVLERLEELARLYDLPEEPTVDALARLLAALAAEPDPPTTVRDPLDAVDQHVADSLSGLELSRCAAPLG